jgi:hypothetical protein
MEEAAARSAEEEVIPESRNEAQAQQPKLPAVGAGGGQRVAQINVASMSPFQKIRYGVDHRRGQ